MPDAPVAGLTVVVPTRDRPQHLGRCLEALAAQLRPGDAVVVVDSAPRAPASPPATCGPAPLQHLVLDLPGASRARNAGWRAATTERVAFVDDDCVVAPGWREATDVDAPFVLGQVAEHPDDIPAEHPLALAAGDACVVDARGPLVPGGAGNLVVRRSALAALGGFDEQLGPGTWFASAEDLDLVDRLVLAGHVGRFEPDMLAWHVQWRSSGEALRTHWAYGKGMGARLSRLSRTDRPRARLLLPGVTRLGGVKTAAAEVGSGTRRSWGPPIAWRLGALVGIVAGYARLPAVPRRSS